MSLEENKKICVYVDGKLVETEEGASLESLAELVQKDYPEDILLALVNGKLRELPRTVPKDGKISFLTGGTVIGNQTYRRSMTMLMVKSIYDVFGHDKVSQVRVHYSISKGYYCTISGDVKINREFLDKVEEKMRSLVEAKVPIVKLSLPTWEAIEHFHRHHMYDKERLFEYRRSSRVNLYRLGNFEDYYYGYMVSNTKYLKYFQLHLYDEGFVLQMPIKEEPKAVPKFCPQNKLFEVLKESTGWGDMQGIENVGNLNDFVASGQANDMILVQEALQERKIAEIAGMIAKDPKKKFVLIAGPSSSGKTTFSHRLSIQLRARGLHPHPIAVDNYFCERMDTPKDAEGNYDFECLEAVDLDLFNRHLTDLLKGKRVEIPRFNFLVGKKEYHGDFLQLKEQDVLIIEGIHCLNDQLTPALPKERKFKIYISALTQLNIDEHNRIPTTDGRLLRRMVRDARTRGASAAQTIGMWNSVRRGEEKYIFPYQEEADVMFNSALIYELSVLKGHVEPLLFGIDKSKPEYLEAKRLLKFLDYFLPVQDDMIPQNSLIREFIGGGCFRV